MSPFVAPTLSYSQVLWDAPPIYGVNHCHSLDLRVYARAAAWIAGIDRGPQARLTDLKAQIGVTVDGWATEVGSPSATVAAPGTARRRRVRSSYVR